MLHQKQNKILDFLKHISAGVSDFWTSDLNQKTKNQDQTVHPSAYLYVNTIPVDQRPSRDLSPSPALKPETDNASLQNGDTSQSIGASVRASASAKTNQEIKYKRPPPRPPSLGSGSGTGLLFPSPPPPQISTAAAQQAERKEEGKRGTGEGEERKSLSTSPPPPSRPPVPLQGRGAPPLPPAPLGRTSSRKSTDWDKGRDKGQNPARKAEREGGAERGKEKTGSRAGLLGEEAGREDEEEKEDKQKSSPQCPTAAKKPSRPIPPPRTKPCLTDSPGCSSQAAGGPTNQSAGMRIPPPPSARRPDVSLYSPQGGAVLGPDPDSCSTSSTEEEAEPNQDQEQNHRYVPVSCSDITEELEVLHPHTEETRTEDTQECPTHKPEGGEI